MKASTEHHIHQTTAPMTGFTLYRITSPYVGILKVAVVRPFLRSLTLSSSQRVSYSTGVKQMTILWESIARPPWELPYRKENSFILNCNLPICQCTKQQMYLYSSHDHSVLSVSHCNHPFFCGLVMVANLHTFNWKRIAMPKLMTEPRM